VRADLEMDLRQDEKQRDGRNWYALTVKHQHEKAVVSGLQTSGFESLLPLYKTLRTWSDRTKQLESPLFAGYVFAQFSYDDRVRVLRIPAVRNIVGFGGAPARLAPEEVADIRAAIESKLPLRPWPYLKEGDRVRVERGPLRGVEGTLLQERDLLRLVIGVEILQRSVAVEVSPEMIIPLRSAAPVRFENLERTRCAGQF
jgi:transcription antitermination factor NusG